MFCTSETVVLELQHVLDALFGNTLFPRSLGILGASHLMYPSTCPASRRVCARAREGITDFRWCRPADLPPITGGTPAETMPLEAPGGAVSGLTALGGVALAGMGAEGSTGRVWRLVSVAWARQLARRLLAPADMRAGATERAGLTGA